MGWDTIWVTFSTALVMYRFGLIFVVGLQLGATFSPTHLVTLEEEAAARRGNILQCNEMAKATLRQQLFRQCLD
jgi:preprotein translocase subunit SecF